MSNPAENPTPSQESLQQQLEKIAKHNFDEVWNMALQTKNPEDIAKLYSEKNTFLPTVSPDYKKGREAAEKYFHHFEEINPYGKIITGKVIPISANVYLHYGEYDFIVDTPDKKGRTTIHADFTYVWEKNEAGEWQIIHHHSAAKSGLKISQDFLQGKILDESFQQLSPETILHSGLYTYTEETPEGSKNIEARFTSLEEEKDGKVKVLYQQLSERPKG